MKTSRYISILLILFTGTMVRAQNLIQDFESGDRSGQGALCWSFPGTSFINTSEVITGLYSGRTGQLTSLVNWNGVVSPWMQVAPGNLTFKQKK